MRSLATQSRALFPSSESQFLPRYEGFFEFQNPLLDAARGGAFAEPEPLLLMEMLPGRDLDRWLARVHHSNVPQARIRRNLGLPAEGSS